MAETHNGVMTFTAGEALEPYRRVKYGSTDGTVSYADASDKDNWLGVTLPNAEGDGVASGDFVSVQLRTSGATFRCQTAAAMSTKNAAVYPADDGKVTGTGIESVGQLAGDSTAGSGGYVAFIPLPTTGHVPNELSIEDADATTGASVPVILKKTGVTASGDTAIPQPARKLRPVLAWAALRDVTTATNVKLKIASTDISATVGLATTADVNTLININDAVTEIPETGTIYVNVSTTATAPGVDVFVLCQPVA